MGVRYSGADYVIADLDSIGQVHHDSGIPVTGARLDIGDSIAFCVPEEMQPSVIWAPYPVSFEPFVEDPVPFPVTKPILFRRVRLD